MHRRDVSDRKYAVLHVHAKFESCGLLTRNRQNVLFVEKTYDATMKLRPYIVTEVNPRMGPVGGKTLFKTGSTYMVKLTEGEKRKFA